MSKPVEPRDELRPVTPPTSKSPAVRTRSRLLVIAVVALLGSAWVIHGPVLDEQRVPAAFPAIDRATIAQGVPDGSLFRQIDAALADGLPARSPVLRTVLTPMVAAGLSPNAIVYRGPSGEPFYSAEFGIACEAQAGIAGLDHQIRALRTKLKATGATLLYAIAPDKSQVDRAELGPLADKLLVCSDVNVTTFEKMAAAPDSPEFVDFDGLAKANKTKRQYMEGDTHWNFVGGSTFAHDLLIRLEHDGVIDKETVDASNTGTAPAYVRVDDLYRLMGVPRTERFPVTFRAPAGTSTTSETQPIEGDWYVAEWKSTSTDAKLVPGRTLLIADSFAGLDIPYLVHYFSDITYVPFAVLQNPGHLISTTGYDHVIIQELQRNVPNYIDQIDQAPWITGPHAAH